MNKCKADPGQAQTQETMRGSIPWLTSPTLITPLPRWAWPARLVAAIQHAQEERACRAIYRQTARDLNSLTERDLADLGISRAMITRLSRDATWSVKSA